MLQHTATTRLDSASCKRVAFDLDAASSGAAVRKHLIKGPLLYAPISLIIRLTQLCGV